MGRIAAPYGVRGWVKIQPFTTEVDGLLAYPTWWIGQGGDWREMSVAEGRGHGRWLVARLAGCEDRDAAGALRKSEIAVPRSRLPQAQPGEYYWADLIGLSVVNEAGVQLGRVRSVFATGANDVLVVDGDRERLIPFTAEAVAAIDVDAGTMRVNWAAEW